MLGDPSRVINDEVVKKFLDFHNHRSDSPSELISALEIHDNTEDCRKEVLNVLHNTRQLTSQQLNNLVNLSE